MPTFKRNKRIIKERIIALFSKGENPKCIYCKEEIKEIELVTIDHLIPRSREGGSGKRRSNLGISCRKCNETKGDMTKKEYLYFLRDGEYHQDYVTYLSKKNRKIT